MGTSQVMKTIAAADLRCHKAVSSGDVRAIHVIVGRTIDELEVGFRLDGNISGIRLAALTKRDPHAELWRHTCFEAFVAVDGQPAYYEFNFAPSRAWRVYAFRDYRELAPLKKVSQWPTVAVNTTEERLELDARIVLTDLSAIYSRSPLRLGLSAVIESWNGSLSYWALHHPAGQPDFHHADGFALRLQPPDSE
jgi:hypothetical protein